MARRKNDVALKLQELDEAVKASRTERDEIVSREPVMARLGARAREIYEENSFTPLFLDKIGQVRP